MIRALTIDEIATVEFTYLLWLAVEVDDDELDRIKREELGHLTILGTVEGDRVTAFAAYMHDVDRVVIEYIAVNETAQGRGLGTALVRGIREAANSRPVFAATDDDAVEFYRRIGFSVTSSDHVDPRWPDRQRYDCLLL
jgi:ribosomal protein S18 acetylase RimI-like enzyme